MKIRINKENLVYGLQVAAKAVPNKVTIEALLGVELITKDNELLLRSTDLEIELTCRVPATVEEDGKVVVPAKKMLELARKLPNEEIVILTEESHMNIKYGKNKAKFNCYDVNSFPTKQEWDKSEDSCFALKANEFQQAAKKVQLAVSKNESRPIFTGVCLQSNKNGISLIATDTYRLAWKKLFVENMPQKVEVVLPGRAIAEIGKLPCAEEEMIDIAVNKDKTKVLFKVKDIEMVTRVLTGEYPNCAQIVPKKATTSVEVAREDFLTITERCALIASEIDNNVINLEVNGALTLSADTNIGMCKEELDDIEKEGQDIKLACNAHFLIDGLKANNGSKVTVSFNGPKAPTVIKSVDDPNYLYLFLPVFQPGTVNDTDSGTTDKTNTNNVH
jgi:DNA polymerase-3 subunit beta